MEEEGDRRARSGKGGEGGRGGGHRRNQRRWKRRSPRSCGCGRRPTQGRARRVRCQGAEAVGERMVRVVCSTEEELTTSGVYSRVPDLHRAVRRASGRHRPGSGSGVSRAHGGHEDCLVNFLRPALLDEVATRRSRRPGRARTAEIDRARRRAVAAAAADAAAASSPTAASAGSPSSAGSSSAAAASSSASAPRHAVANAATVVAERSRLVSACPRASPTAGSICKFGAFVTSAYRASRAVS